MPLFVFLRFEVVKLPCALTLECHIVGLIAVDAAVVEVETLDALLGSLGYGHKHRLAADDAVFVIGVTLRCKQVVGV